MILYLIRHGLTKENREKRYLGKTDAPLLPESVNELRQKKSEGFYPETDFVFSGPMLRCRQTAEALYPDLSPKLIPEWTELDFGRFEGKTYEELKDDPLYVSWIADSETVTCPEGESRRVFISRSLKGYYRLMDICEREGKESVVAVVHGGTIMALLSVLDGKDYYDYQVKAGFGYGLRLTETEEGFCLDEFWEIGNDRSSDRMDRGFLA